VMPKRGRDELTTVVYYGSQGSFSEDAALKYFGPGSSQYKTELDAQPSRSLDELFAKVSDGVCEFGVVPLENNVSGLLQDVLLNLVRSPDLHIVGEVLVAEEHCLCVVPGSSREAIRTVISHPHLLQQIDAWLCKLEKENGCNPIERHCTFDSVGACKLVDAPSKAAISSRRAGLSAGLEIVGSKLANLESETRYIVLSTAPATISNRLGLRCSVSFMLHNQEGALFKSLSCFAFRNLNITKINTLPLGGAAEELIGSPGNWQYGFVVDFKASNDEQVNEAALQNLREFAANVRILGVYTTAESALAQSRNQHHSGLSLAMY